MPDQISLLDLMDLPISLRRIVRMVLREITMTYSEILKALDRLPDSQRPDQRSTDTALDELTRRRVLIRFISNSEAVYRVNLARRAPRPIDSVLWQKAGFDSLEQADQQWRPDLQTSTPSSETNLGEVVLWRGGKRKLPTAIWESLEAQSDSSAKTSDNPTETSKENLRNRLFNKLDEL